MFSLPYTYKLHKILKNIEESGKLNLVNDIYFSTGALNSSRNVSLNEDEYKELISIKEKYGEKYGIKLNYTFNPTYYNNKIYLEEGHNHLLEVLKNEHKLFNFEIITINNVFFLKNPEIRNFLEENNIKIKISVNNQIDSLEKLAIIADYNIDEVTLDRSLNRNQDELEKCYKFAEENGIKISLLVNEGCIPNCPYKQQCDLMISQYYQNTEKEVNILSAVHDFLGCTVDFINFPYLGLQSPFISPLAIPFYKNKYPNIIYKIAGRGKEKYILEKIIMDYILFKGDSHLEYFFSTFRQDKFNFYDLEEYNFSSKTSNCKLQCHNCPNSEDSDISYCEMVYNKLNKD